MEPLNLAFLILLLANQLAGEIVEVNYFTPADTFVVVVVVVVVVDSLPILIKSWLADRPAIRDSCGDLFW